MKLNFLPTLTSQKIFTLFFFVFLETWKVDGGGVFKGCLNLYNITSSSYVFAYDALVGFFYPTNTKLWNDNKINGSTIICCDNFSCFFPKSEVTNCRIYGMYVGFLCRKIDRTFFCESYFRQCGGIVGDKLITNNTTIGLSCPSLDKVANDIKITSTGFTPWGNGGKQQDYGGELLCHWDNHGWTCSGANSFTANSDTERCYLQWKWSPSPSQSTILSPSSTPPSNFNSHLIGKTIISIGTVVGVISIGGITYYLIKRKNNEKIHQSIEKIMKLLINGGLKEKDAEKTSELFKTWFNNSCAITIDKGRFLSWKSVYNLWITTHELAFGKVEEKINCLKVGKLTPVKDKWEEIMEDFKKILNSEHPAAEIYNSKYTTKLPPLTQNYKNVKKIVKDISSDDNPDDYVKPYDIVRRKIKGTLNYHAAIYLGKKKVAHISNPEGKKAPGGLYAREDNWENFLKDAKEIEIHHPFIPFKKPELIQKHIEIAVNVKYGEGKYKLFGNNCEHFATMCVYGLGMSQQTRSIIGKSDYLLKAIEESNKLFEELVENERILNLKKSDEKNQVVDLDEWAEEKEEVEFQIQIPPK